ncbi:unnamed protein product [Cyprideis torosa]|uniref:Uncharacterized protein n=1 Tax=Cyprideis torosa TaxID=163714 RepID=A0A7R8WVM5_9CRUS|nr:unnamed protein product [Cyprideis torosa]CAG0910993.1 unnamed protein product [Cyprideis torosa]
MRRTKLRCLTTKDLSRLMARTKLMKNEIMDRPPCPKKSLRMARVAGNEGRFTLLTRDRRSLPRRTNLFEKKSRIRYVGWKERILKSGRKRKVKRKKGWECNGRRV